LAKVESFEFCQKSRVFANVEIFGKRLKVLKVESFTKVKSLAKVESSESVHFAM